MSTTIYRFLFPALKCRHCIAGSSADWSSVSTSGDGHCLACWVCVPGGSTRDNAEPTCYDGTPPFVAQLASLGGACSLLLAMQLASGNAAC